MERRMFTRLFKHRLLLGAVALAVVGTFALVIGSLRSNAATSVLKPLYFTSGDSGCTHREDPANFEMQNVKINFALSLQPDQTRSGAQGAGTMARDRWNGGIGSTKSWKFFGNQYPPACNNESEWATSSREYGHHVRFWQYGSLWYDVPGAVHEDCPVWNGTHTLFTHSSRWYDIAANDLASWLYTVHDTSGHRAFVPDPSSTHNGKIGIRQDRPPWPYYHCGTHGTEHGLVFSVVQAGTKGNSVKIGVPASVLVEPPEKP